MFKKVIVGVDGRQGSRDAIALAKQLVADDGEFALSYVYLGNQSPVRGSRGAFEASERRRAFDLLARARNEGDVQTKATCRPSCCRWGPCPSGAVCMSSPRRAAPISSSWAPPAMA